MPFIGERPWVLLLVLAIILIIWGPGKLPEVGGAIGRAIREFRRSSSEFGDEIRRSADQPHTPSVSSSPETTSSTQSKPAPDVKAPSDTSA